jgi:hypothetical protein
LEVSGKKYIIDLWPNFELVVHGGVSFIPYQKQFEEICGPGVNYLEVYNSQGVFLNSPRNDISKDTGRLPRITSYNGCELFHQFAYRLIMGLGCQKVKLS